MRAGLRYIVVLGSGAAASLLPLGVLSVSAHVLNIHTLGLLAVTLAFGTFLGQLLGAVYVEAPLAGAKSRGLVRLPHIITICGVSAGTLSAFTAAFSPIVYSMLISCASAVAISSRMSAVANGRTRREGVAAGVLAAGVLSGLALSAGGYPYLAVSSVSIGVAAMIVIRVVRGCRQLAEHPKTTLWVLADTSATGVIMPLLSVFTLGQLGPAAAVTFRLSNTLASVTDPAIAYVRVRSLREESRRTFLGTLAALFAIVALTTVLTQLGFLSNFLGPAWAGVTPLLAVLAMTSRISYLLTTPSFARLRRDGRVRTVAGLRLATSVLYLVLGGLAALLGDVRLIFLSFIVAEVLNAFLFRLTARRVLPSSKSPA